METLSGNKFSETKIWVRLLESTTVGLIFFALYWPYLSQPAFLDEIDNMLGGNVVNGGGLIYVDYLSQHTPLAYWISAAGYELGFDSFLKQRFFGYLIFALVVAFIYFRNAPRFGRLPLIAFAILSATIPFANPEVSYTVISDQYQALFMAAIAFETIYIGLSRHDSRGTWIVIGTGSALAVGVAFVTIYFVAVAIFCALVVSWLNSRAATNPIPIRTRIWELVIRLLIVAGAFSVLILAPLALTNTLPAAFEQAYLLNRNYYAKYLKGFGDSVLAPLLDGVREPLVHAWHLPQLISSNPMLGFREFASLAIVLVAAVFMFYLRPIAGISFVLMFLFAGTRGWYGAHAQSLWIFFVVSFVLLPTVIQSARNKRLQKSGFIGVDQDHQRPLSRIALYSAWAVMGILATMPYVTQISEQGSSILKPASLTHTDRSNLIESLVPPNETYGETSVWSVADLVITRRWPAGGFAGVVPWFADAMENDMVSKLEKDNPRIIFHSTATEVWGVNIASHAQLLDTYVQSHYTPVQVTFLSPEDTLWIRNDILPESLAIIRELFGLGSVQELTQ